MSSVWMQAEMSEDEGHSHGDAESDADDDGDLVSVNAACMQCKKQLGCFFISIAIGFLVGLFGPLRYETCKISTLAAFLPQLHLCECCKSILVIPHHSVWHCYSKEFLKNTRVCDIHLKATVWHDDMLVLQISLLHLTAVCDGAVMHRQRYETNVELLYCQAPAHPSTQCLSSTCGDTSSLPE